MPDRRKPVRVARAENHAAEVDRLLRSAAIPAYLGAPLRRHVGDLIALLIEAEDALRATRVRERQHAALLHQLATPAPATPDHEAVPL